jgi:predicted lactoylglutathione lyase
MHERESPVIGYVTLGTNNFEASAKFYDELLSALGAARAMDEETFIAWGTAPDQPMLSIIKPFDGQPASVGNGVMVGLQAASKEQVDEIHAKALALGAADEGAPGPRGEGFYAGYFRDPEGNKLNAFFAG